ncbi:MAG: hypothetical protein A2020_10250 [Lentisphaerae bacterium GWF2_45_14]|nr:MAG: hypothetical protein A2020_10250 [Lentisphaerae bacterium GWF2_45_14]
MNIFSVGKILMAFSFFISTAEAGETIVKPVNENGNWIFRSGESRVVVGKNGYITNLTTGGSEFLANSKDIPAASYLCEEGDIPALSALSVQDDATLKGTCQLGEISYRFNGSSLFVTLNAFDDEIHFYIIASPDVKKLEYMAHAGDVPTITAPPAKASCSVVRLYIDDNCLDVSGINSIWGPWKGFQVLDISLKKGENRNLKIEMSSEKENDNNVETVSKSLKKMSSEFSYQEASTPSQIPLCMIGDSITWAGEGDCWRKYLLENFPSFAFIGTHSAKFGYSHAGEGGNNTRKVLARMTEIPDCPYYSLLIGTNDTGIRDESKIEEKASETAVSIKEIVSKLLDKKGVRKVFLCSILPCFTDNPLRDRTNSAVNKILRSDFEKGLFPADKVMWIEFENPIRKIPGWEKLILLHPTPEGYKIIAKIHADAIMNAIGITDKSPAIPHKNTGVRIYNLWDKTLNFTKSPIIPGWYTVSFDLKEHSGSNASLRICGPENLKDRLDKTFKIKKQNLGKRVTIDIFTGYEGYGYAVSELYINPSNCVIDNILFEKRRPSGLASTYGEGVYFDSATRPVPGELVESVK